MTKKERESQKRVEKALRNPFYTIHLTPDEWKRYKRIKDSLRALEELES